jgi:hypothetical protein
VIDTTTLKRLTLSRYYLSLAADHAKSARELDSFAAVNILQESIETFLVAGASHLNAAVGPKEGFDGYFNKIDAVLSPARLPFRSKLLRLNKARVASKHDSIVPDRSEIPGFVTSTREFLEESSQLIFQMDFRTVSLIDALPDSEEKAFLKQAETAFAEGDYLNTLVFCRRAFYTAFEQNSDIKDFKDSNGGLFGFLCEAPAHAKSSQYIAMNVREPFDYIVLDMQKVDDQILKLGIDIQQFWNIWRLTPKVYKLPDGTWLCRHEPSKIHDTIAEANASYVLENTVDMFVTRSRANARQRLVHHTRWTATVGPTGADLFSKADQGDEPRAALPAGTKVEVEGASPGIDGTDLYWKVIHVVDYGNPWTGGYILQSKLIL